MTKHEADVIGGLNMTDQISNEAYKQIMIAAQDENEEVSTQENLLQTLYALESENERMHDVLDKIRAEIEALPKTYPFINHIDTYVKEDDVLQIIDKYRKEQTT